MQNFLWTGLLNSDGVLCKGRDCDGKVFWMDGTPFIYFDNMGDRFPTFDAYPSALHFLHGGTKHGDDFVGGVYAHLICQHDCSGSSELCI